MSAKRKIERLIERKLPKARVAYVKEPVVGRTQPDFLVTTPAGDRIVIEAKAWQPGRKNVARAVKQARTYARLSKTAGALLVTPNSVVFCSADGEVIPVPDLKTAFASFAMGKSRLPKTKKTRRRTRETHICVDAIRFQVMIHIWLRSHRPPWRYRRLPIESTTTANLAM
jgi:hypothetical protein